MDTLETRQLAYFVAVAEELHFGRAAQRLGMAQPPLSRAIKQLERRLGVTLLDRTSRIVTLTPAGEVLLREARAALDAVVAAARRTQRAGHSDPRLVLAMKPSADGGLLPAVLNAYAARPGAPEVEVVCSFRERGAMLRDGRADVALMHAPYEDFSGLAVEELLVEDQVAVVPQWHRLAGLGAVSMADLAGETLPRWPRRAESGSGPVPEDGGQLMQLIALDRMIAVLPESVRGHLREELTCVPVVDATPTTLVVAWPEHSRSREVASFVQTATTVAADHRATTRATPATR
ncbi:LysR family transcriptional regulator [Sphaerisporangium melleum]|uniref:LysR family transcriptional regulator n=1 Tax=Sphaerisporangium melleum TaxID=321316 RepID=A0A917VIB0_9ACTN|nr:LysR family transcriptional regulator [Sphaerisporangium melleum]GGK86564.1 LysR family transcriptional regulator [Sphaerisporangium melleum]GII71522.1 LysR family transcriptional regulator [Sphaerisporangium melleum]